MLRLVGFTLLLLGLSAPSWALVCDFRCPAMQTPDHSSFALEEGLPPCCGTPQVMTGRVSVVKPQAQFRNIVQPQRQADLHVAESVSYTALAPIERRVFLPSGLSPAILRI